MDIAEIIGKNAKAYRIQKGMTQDEVAQKMGIHRPQLVNYEAGKHFKINILEKWAAALNVTPINLLQETGEMQTHAADLFPGMPQKVANLLKRLHGKAWDVLYIILLQWEALQKQANEQAAEEAQKKAIK